MRLFAIAFLAGIMLFLQFSFLPDSRWALVIVIIALVIIYTLAHPTDGRHSFLFLLYCFIGLLWALFRANLFFNSGGVSAELEGTSLLVSGVVVSIAKTSNRKRKFEFEIQSMRYQGEPVKPAGRVQLSWYNGYKEVKLGEHWRFLVKLKRPHGFMNPGGFDYEAWLFLKGIHATGYIKNKISRKNKKYYSELDANINIRLSDIDQASLIDRFRQQLFDKISIHLASYSSKGLIKALAIGDKQDITRAQWDILTRTGTNHLMAISGLHIGLVAGIVFFIMKWLWCMTGLIQRPVFLSRACLFLPASKFAALFAVFAALFYAMLAGFSIPTQRALVMVALVMFSVFLQREPGPSVILALALTAILVIDPFAAMDAGFWLSFAAVAIILFGMSARMIQKNVWWKWGRVQWVVTIGLLPLTLFFFQKTSLISPLANIVAVPWVSVITVPLTLTGSVALFLYDDVGALLLKLAAASFDLLMAILEKLAAVPFANWQQFNPVGWHIIPAMIGIIWLLMPHGVPARWIGLLGLLPMFLVKPVAVKEGDFQFTLLDVGQGLAAVVETRQHVLVFDTGPRFSDRFNTGSAVIVPFLHHRGIDVVDTLLISHADNDHIGGMEAVVEAMDVKLIMTSVPEKINYKNTVRCVNTQTWQWNKVKFEIISPPSIKEGSGNRRSSNLDSANNASCVLKVSNLAGSVLITGDIEKSAENYLLRRYKKGAFINGSGIGVGLEDSQITTLAADILVVPHHGSNTSSTEPFVKAVGPKYALFAVGYRNRFGLPRERVVDRYKAIEATIFDTAKQGAIEFSFVTKDVSTEVPADLKMSNNTPVLFRSENRRFFNQ